MKKDELENELNSGKIMIHKYLGRIELRLLKTDKFYANTIKGVLPFLYDDIGKVISLELPNSESNLSAQGIEHENRYFEESKDLGYNPSLYVKKRRTSFPFTGQTTSEKRHSLNSKKRLR